MLVTLEGMLILAKVLQPWHIDEPIVLTFSPIAKACSFSHLLKADAPILVTALAEYDTVSKFKHEPHKAAGRAVTFAGTAMDVKPEL
jgi:hypothetical protein